MIVSLGEVDFSKKVLRHVLFQFVKLYKEIYQNNQKEYKMLIYQMHYWKILKDVS